ncbi:uncharacterized protein LOC116259076 [Nymphaea colorata]|nr:uncharacterized protein LOC116259076 [Nymphaea colorata]XP_031492552.1 uncharacterized protein LOC116259076 [Nymphaea colorata]
MAETKDAHVVVISTGDEDHLQETLISSAHHPLQEISESPGHLLLLKLWQREEDLFARRITTKETRIDNIRREVFQLCCFFFAFHGFFLTLLFVSSNNFNENSCRKWWVPCFLYLVTSVVMILCVQYKVYRYMKMSARLQKERGDSRALSRCIQELRMKGASFDLSKEPLSNVRRIKSSSVEVKLTPLRWCSQNLVTICLICVTGLVFPASRYILCS